MLSVICLLLFANISAYTSAYTYVTNVSNYDAIMGIFTLQLEYISHNSIYCVYDYNEAKYNCSIITSPTLIKNDDKIVIVTTFYAVDEKSGKVNNNVNNNIMTRSVEQNMVKFTCGIINCEKIVNYTQQMYLDVKNTLNGMSRRDIGLCLLSGVYLMILCMYMYITILYLRILYNKCIKKENIVENIV